MRLARYFIVLVAIFVFFSFPILSYANYTEDFNDSDFNSVLWIEERGNFPILIAGGISYTSLSSENFTTTYPYLRTLDLNDDNVDFEYSHVMTRFLEQTASQGAGIIFSDNTPHIGDNLDFNSLLLFVWAKPDGTFHLFPTICPVSNPTCNVSNQLSNGVYAFPQNEWGDIEVDYNGSYYVVKYKDEIVFESVNTTRKITSIGFGSPLNANTTQVWPKFDVDYFSINTDLPVTFPHYSQLDSLWAGNEYDHASTWAEAGKQEMEEWGCAVTSAAMILKHYEVKHPETGEDTTPKNLNDWLSNTASDGYVRNGLTNWLAITRYARLSKLAGYSPNSLEFVKEAFDATNVSGQLAEDPSIPTIVKNDNSHYLTIYGEDGEDWLVADPLESENGRYAKIGSLLNSNTYIPSNTDLSYMMFVIEPGTVLKLYDELDNLLTTDSEIEQLEDGSEVQIVYYRKPTTGTYRLVVTNPNGSSSPVEMYFYNLEGEVELNSDEVEGGGEKEWEINYYREGEMTTNVSELDVTPPTVPTLSSPADGAHAKPTGLILDWDDVTDPSTPVTYNFKLAWTGGSSGPTSTGSDSYVDLSGSADRTYTWQVQACDSVDNCSEWTATREFVVDSLLPLLATVPTTDSPTNSTTQDWSWTEASDEEGEISGYSTRTYNVLTSTYLNDWLWLGQVLGTTTNLTEGEWKLDLKAKDEAGNESETGSSDTVLVDTTTPVLSSQTSFSENWYNAIPTVVFTYSDDHLLSDYVSPSCEITTESTASYCWVKPYICDTAGNCNNEKVYSANIKLDLTKPKVVLSEWGSKLSGTASDTLSGVEKVVIRLTKPGEVEATFTATGTTNWSYTIESAAVGDYKAIIISYDYAGNLSEEIVKEYSINASDPAASTASPTPSPTPTPTPTPFPSFAPFTSWIAPTPSPSPSPTASPEPEVLGESDNMEDKVFDWRWLFALSPLPLWFVFRKMK